MKRSALENEWKSTSLEIEEENMELNYSYEENHFINDSLKFKEHIVIICKCFCQTAVCIIAPLVCVKNSLESVTIYSSNEVVNNNLQLNFVCNHSIWYNRLRF